MFPEHKHQHKYYALHVHSLCNIAAQTRLIEFEGIENSSNLANYTDDEIDTMADQNSKCTPATQHVTIGKSCTKNMKEELYWVQKKVPEGGQLELSELTVPSIDLLISKVAAAKENRGLGTDS